MKKWFFILLLLLPGFSALAGGPYFCNQAGRKLYYERYSAGKGKLVQTTVLDFMAVNPDETGLKVEYVMSVTKPNGRPLYGGPADLTVVITAGNDVLMDLGDSIQKFLKNLFPHSRVKMLENIPALIPAAMQPGDTLPDTHFLMNVGSLKCSINVDGRTVLRNERIETPAGTFDCMVVRERKTEKQPIATKVTWSDSWYAPGIGYVRHDSYDKNMELESSELLIRIDEQ